MKLARVRIEKFRGIRNADIQLRDELAIVGQNSAGKSSILRALNSFFNFHDEQQHFEKSRHAFQKTSTATIDLEFSEVPQNCQLPRSAANSTSVRARLKYKKTPIWQIFSNGRWDSAPSDLHEELGRYIRYVYIPTSRTDSALAWAKESLLQEAVISWLKNYTRNRDTISPRVTQVTDTIKNRTFTGLSKTLRKLTHLHGSFEFDIDYASPPNYQLLVQDLVLRVVDGDTSIDISDCGSGTQSMAAIAMYSYLAETLDSTYILGIEEPEQNLHPQAQRSLFATLKGLPLQVCFTTHSTVMLDSLDHEDVVLCRRVSSNTRSFEITTTQLPETFWDEKDIDRTKYYSFHRRRNSEFFYADFVILTESPIDSLVVEHLINSGGLDTSYYSVSIVSLDGVQALPYAYHLLKELDVSFAAVVDKDYFLPYLNDELESSRDSKGFPKYKKEYQTDCLIEEMRPSQRSRARLMSMFHKNHSKAMDLLENNNVFCFRFSLEIDLLGSNTATQDLYQLLNVPAQDRITSELLVNRKKQLKKLSTVLEIVSGLSPSALPNSYKRLRKRLPELIENSTSR
ncbi:AAA family ATPase [Thalassospiraceae bacterium SW-3-3]|nr:AAA family ATPase [Thalassospiraceae bacterium SW-3-3]